jgi:preprotein translocase subunit YajC
MTASLLPILPHAPLLAAAAKAASTSQSQSSSSFLVILLPLLVIGYFLLVRPQRQRARQQQQQRQQIGVGDHVVTVGGLVGRVTRLSDERATLEVAPGISMEFVRQAISRRLADAELGSGAGSATSTASGLSSSGPDDGSREAVTEDGKAGTGAWPDAVTRPEEDQQR